jgi:hypothetical protein
MTKPAPKVHQESETALAARLTALRASPAGQAILRKLDKQHGKVAKRSEVAQAAQASRIGLTGSRGVRCLPRPVDPGTVHTMPALKPSYAAGLRAKLER